MNEIYLNLLKLLHENKDSFVSGEEISNKLGVSRTTIWKNINKLKDKGYIIESVTNRGYSLRIVPDKLLVEEVKVKLSTEEIGKEILFYSQLNSTNVRAKELVRKGYESGTVVLAEEQTAGKGRMGRKWFSPPGKGLWFSIILRPDISPVKSPFLTIVASLAVAGTIEKIIKTYYEQKKFILKIKWPNDVLLNNKKVAGILSELSADMDQIKYAIVGIGINVNQDSFPEDLDQVATSIKKCIGKNIKRVNLIQEILNRFEKFYFKLVKGQEDQLITLWKNNLNMVGEKVIIFSDNRTYEGIVYDISSRGELLLKDGNGDIHTFWAGDVSLQTKAN